MDNLLTPDYAMHMNTLESTFRAYRTISRPCWGVSRWRFVHGDMLRRRQVVLRYTFYRHPSRRVHGLPCHWKASSRGGDTDQRIVDGRIAEEWEVFDAATMFRFQMGMA